MCCDLELEGMGEHSLVECEDGREVSGEEGDSTDLGNDLLVNGILDSAALSIGLLLLSKQTTKQRYG